MSKWKPARQPHSDRTTVLLLGSDQRNGVAQSINTDTMLVLSVDRVQHTALMLSLPRDIYTEIPGTFQQGRIGTAYAIGQAHTPGGGGNLAIRTVEQLLGIPIDAYMLVDFAVFYAVIDIIGPITVCPKQPIYDDRFPSHANNFTTVSFPAGCQELGAVELLQYARVRHNAGYDFGRAQRQQEIIRGIRSRILSLRGVVRLSRRFVALWRTIKANTDTNMALEQILHWGVLALRIPRQNIYSAVLTVQHGHLRNSTTLAGEQVLLPVPGALHDFVQFLFNANPSNVDVDVADLRATSAWLEGVSALLLSAIVRGLDLAMRVGKRLRIESAFQRLPHTKQRSTLPDGFALVCDSPGVRLYRHRERETFVVTANLQQGALVDLIYGDIVDPGTGGGDCGGSSPLFELQTTVERWQSMAQSGLNLFCLTNGQSFAPEEFSAARLSFPLKANGVFVSTGYGDLEYSTEKLMLELWPHKAAIEPFSPRRLLASSAPNILVGLTDKADKSPREMDARTFVGVADSNHDGRCESLLILTSTSTTQRAAANVLRAFGAKKVMMLDGGTSTQLVCRGESKIEGGRTIPQMIAVSGGGTVPAETRTR